MKRITVLVDDELFDRMNAAVPHGFRRHVVCSVLRLVVDAIEADGNIMVGAIMSDQYKLVRDED